MNNKNTQKINFQQVYYKKFIITKKVYYYKKLITKSKCERKKISEIYNKQGKKQMRKKETWAKFTASKEKGKGERKTLAKFAKSNDQKKNLSNPGKMSGRI